MNWYKKAQQIELGSFVLDWLRSSRYQVQDTNAFFQESQAYAGHMIDPNELRIHINTASQKAASEQGGSLTPTQHEFIQSLSASTISEKTVPIDSTKTDPMEIDPMETDPMALEPMPIDGTPL